MYTSLFNEVVSDTEAKKHGRLKSENILRILMLQSEEAMSMAHLIPKTIQETFHSLLFIYF